jgi:hypothetical protein
LKGKKYLYKNLYQTTILVILITSKGHLDLINAEAESIKTVIEGSES